MFKQKLKSNMSQSGDTTPETPIITDLSPTSISERQAHTTSTEMMVSMFRSIKRYNMNQNGDTTQEIPTIMAPSPTSTTERQAPIT